MCFSELLQASFSVLNSQLPSSPLSLAPENVLDLLCAPLKLRETWPAAGGEAIPGLAYTDTHFCVGALMVPTHHPSMHTEPFGNTGFFHRLVARGSLLWVRREMNLSDRAKNDPLPPSQWVRIPGSLKITFPRIGVGLPTSGPLKDADLRDISQ